MWGLGGGGAGEGRTLGEKLVTYSCPLASVCADFALEEADVVGMFSFEGVWSAWVAFPFLLYSTERYSN